MFQDLQTHLTRAFKRMGLTERLAEFAAQGRQPKDDVDHSSERAAAQPNDDIVARAEHAIREARSVLLAGLCCLQEWAAWRKWIQAGFAGR